MLSPLRPSPTSAPSASRRAAPWCSGRPGSSRTRAPPRSSSGRGRPPRPSRRRSRSGWRSWTAAGGGTRAATSTRSGGSTGRCPCARCARPWRGSASELRHCPPRPSRGSRRWRTSSTPSRRRPRLPAPPRSSRSASASRGTGASGSRSPARRRPRSWSPVCAAGRWGRGSWPWSLAPSWVTPPCAWAAGWRGAWRAVAARAGGAGGTWARCRWRSTQCTCAWPATCWTSRAWPA
mmetsp:Transcript_71421/g.220811  ORF Transcript_71421/g.220811 Transcript_71421/m.220811 type:complete len:235 (-) Transcript_71421:355-1059(-)